MSQQAVQELTRQVASTLTSVRSAKKNKPSGWHSSPQAPSSAARVEQVACSRCLDQGFVLLVNAQEERLLARCPACTNWLKHARLTVEEQRHTINDLIDRKDDHRGEMLALRFLGKEMLRDPFGFLAIHGHKGSGKSLLLTALVADFCRQGKSAQYWNAAEIANRLNPYQYRDEKIKVDNIEGSPEAFKRHLKALPVLAIDEIDKLKWSAWMVQEFGELIEHRHRNAATHVTLFAMNKAPETWQNAAETGHIASRFHDGRFYRLWPATLVEKAPACASRDADGRYELPGLFEVTLADIRPQLRRY